MTQEQNAESHGVPRAFVLYWKQQIRRGEYTYGVCHDRRQMERVFHNQGGKVGSCMKKLFCMVLVLMMLTGSASAGFLGIDIKKGSAVDAAFDADTLTLVPADAPDGYTMLSLAPSGNAALAVTEDGALAAVYEGELRLIRTTEERGVRDEYGNLKRYAAQRWQQMLGNEGVVWSPDGRYAVIANVDLVVFRMAGYMDPIMIDVTTGEMFLLATSSGKMRDNCSMMTVARFSRDGKYLYYLVYATLAQDRTPLYRYELATGDTQLCYSGYDMLYYPDMAELKDGGMMLLLDTIRKDEPSGLVILREGNIRWTASEQFFGAETGVWYPQRMLYAYKTGWAVATGRTAMQQTKSNRMLFLQCFKPEEKFAGLGEFIGFDSKTYEAVTVTAEDVRALAEDESPSMSPWCDIACIRLSPDGRYALVMLASPWKPADVALCLLRLEDKAVREISGVEPGANVLKMSNQYPPMAEWNGDTLLLFSEDGPVMYWFE